MCLCGIWLQPTASTVTPCRGEVVEDVESPLPLDTPLLLVKPPMGLATPEIFKLLDLSKCSKASPKKLLQQMKEAGRLTQDMCVNDLERPAFER
jgi:4-diphosphocytidyl-2-C-methyl-D-erythritol kinase